MNVPSSPAAPIAPDSVEAAGAAKSAFGRDLTALLCGIWFVLTGWFWPYLANVFISFPFALLGLYCWRQGRRTAPASLLNRVAGGFLLAGAVLSLAALLLFK